LKEVRCDVCNHLLKRRKYRKVKLGPRCAEKLASGYAGIQLNAFEPLPEVAKT
jgi:uncharacterized CHY-type Zn-finger protein